MNGESAALLLLATWADSGVWQWYHYLLWGTVIIGGFELINYLVLTIPGMFGASGIVVRCKHHDELDWTDMFCITFNRLISTLFTYHVMYFCHGKWAESGHTQWALSEVTVWNTVVALPALYVVYDFFYCLLHMGLHHRSVYALIHKHHHKQKAPSRGIIDAINVHPAEFVSGEYLHLLAIAIVPAHFITVLVFIVLGGIMASLNHTRYNLKLPGGTFQVNFHDHHHVVPNSNYSQYSMLWDHVWGSFSRTRTTPTPP